MQELGISSLTHFQLHLHIPGGDKIHYHYINIYSYSFKLLLALSSSDQCALNNDSSLKDASEIQFFHDADSTAPLNAGPSNAPATEALKQQDEYSNIIQNLAQSQKQCSQKAKGKAKAVDDAYSDPDSDSEDQDSDDEDEDDIPNEELANMLLSKMIPLGARPTDHQLHKSSKCQPKKKQHVSTGVEASSSASVPNPTSHSEIKKKSSIHYSLKLSSWT
ncbi:hypothetical protein ARMGADRAFT_1087700 [Armillaria gallica]|uniref:Uncharacterized protein n=1 Tax=Armillaria gallica TaxID=47427 RepID=A0A2H3DCQ3_ARMGA|nr:hypothetical protein ARMGADRAFT_1087700 [Armillaria gallica]